MFIFSEEKRRQLQEERPELSESELTRLLARMWNDLSEKKKVRLARPEGLPGRVWAASPLGASCTSSPCPRCVWGVSRTGAWAQMVGLGTQRAGRREAVSCGLGAPWGAGPLGSLSPWQETSAPAHASAHPTLAGGGESLQLLDEPRAPPGGGRKADASAVRPQAKYKAREAALKAQSERKPGKLPESPKRAEEIWQQSVIGDYLARFKVAGRGKGAVLGFFFFFFF